MARFMLSHSHGPEECGVVFAAWRGFESPLRRAAATSSCESVDGGSAHAIWWQVDAPDRDAALALLPPFVAERTQATEVKEVPIP